MNSRERYKGHDMLIEVWPIVRRSVPDARLVIAGDGDDVQCVVELPVAATVEPMLGALS